MFRTKSVEPEFPKGLIIFKQHDVHTPKDMCFVSYPIDTHYQAEDLCLDMAARLGISSLGCQFFALYDVAREVYLAPNSSVEAADGECRKYSFKMRLQLPADRVHNLDSGALDYLYLQCRQDFLEDRITYTDSTKIGQEHQLGLVVTDMVRYGKEKQLSLDKLLKEDPEHFMPISFKSMFKGILEKKRLKSNFKPHVETQYEKFRNTDVSRVKLTFLLWLLKRLDHYDKEEFSLADGTKVVVCPYHEKYAGIYRVTKAGEFGFCNIEDLMDISVIENPSTTSYVSVLLNRKEGPPMKVGFKRKDQALSFVALLDSYYRLTEDHHHHLCVSVHSPLLTRLRRICSHGPAGLAWCRQRLVEKHKENKAYNYMLKQRSGDLGSFLLIYLEEGATSSTYFEIHRLPSGAYQIGVTDEPIFKTMQELLAHYRSESGGILLNQCVRPFAPLDPALYPCRRGGRQGEDRAEESRPDDPAGLDVKFLKNITVIDLLGQGRMTEVHLAKQQEQEVAVKQLRLDGDLQSLCTAVHCCATWRHPCIARVFGVCLSNPFRVVLELGDLGPLDKYLKEQRHLLEPYLPGVASQLAQAVFYLEDANSKLPTDQRCYHGSIRCRNVLVFSHSKDELSVKLGDPGMVHACNRLPSSHADNVERMPWLAPECYQNLQHMTIFRDIYALGITLWEVFALGERPFSNLDVAEIKSLVRKGQTLRMPPSCSGVLYIVMARCWDLVPDNRITAKEIVRNVRNLTVQGEQPDEAYSHPQWNNARVQPPNHPQPHTPDGGEGASGGLGLGDGADGAGTRGAGGGTLNSAQSCPSPSDSSFGSAMPLLAGGAPSRTSLLSVATVSTVLYAENGRLPGPRADRQGDAGRPLPEVPQQTNLPGDLDHTSLLLDMKNPDQKLGDGHYGEVYKGLYHNPMGNWVAVAIKRLKPQMYRKHAMDFEREFTMMKRLKHERIVQIIGQCPQRNEDCPMLLVMEYVPKKSLKHFLRRKNVPKIPSSERVRFAKEIAEGMEYLHANKIVHRDLATRNILVTESFHMKISDFGLSRKLENEMNYYRSTPNKEIPALWSSIEGLSHGKFTMKGDVWSFGVTLWEIFNNGNDPVYPGVKGVPELIEAIKAGKRLPGNPDWPEGIYAFMCTCWKEDPRDRKEFVDIVATMLDTERQLSAANVEPGPAV